MTLVDAREQSCDDCGLVSLHCASCAIEFGITTELYYIRKNDGATFHCPNGHSNIYSADTGADRKAAHKIEMLEAELAESKASQPSIKNLFGKKSKV